MQGVEHGEGVGPRQTEHGPHALQFQGSNNGLSASHARHLLPPGPAHIPHGRMVKWTSQRESEVPRDMHTGMSPSKSGLASA